MSGQYPPPNPYGGHHQRAPPSPWAHAHPRHPQTHQSGMVWSPHVGLPARGAQMWPPKPVDSRPLYGLQGLQMMMGSPQQEETMDLSASAQDVPKTMGDPLRNGTVNGETDSVVTSVIATNPFRDAAVPSVDPINCSKRVEEATAVWESTGSDNSVHVSEPEKICTSSVLVPDEAAVEHVSKNDSTDLDRLSDFSFSANFTKETEERSSLSVENVNKSDLKDIDSSVKEVEHLATNESHSYLDNSYLSVDTDESRLVVAESSADDIFGISPVGNVNSTGSQEIQKSESSNGVISSSGTVSDDLIDSPTPRQWSIKSEMPVAPTLQHSLGPDPSVENVETLLESMFNSQEETSCSSQTSSSGVPQSVIVSNGARLPTEVPMPTAEMIKPMQEEELAKTLAEDIIPEVDVKEDHQTYVNNETKKDMVEDSKNNIQEEPTDLIQSPVPEPPNNDDQIKKEFLLSETDENDSKNDKVINEDSAESILPNSIPTPMEESKIKDEEKLIGKDEDVAVSTSNAEPSTSNPFIEVETQLEKMFAGIVEPLDEVSSDALTQPSGSDLTNISTGKKLVRKRKKANSRRPSDNSVFGGSSGESALIKKKGRKRVRDSSGSVKGSKKIKFESGDNVRKGKAIKENANDGLYAKVKGPYLHFEGPKESPESEVLVNSGSRIDDDDGGEKGNIRWKHSTPQKPEGFIRRAGPAYSSSTLSMRYNSDTPDATWVCVFCKRGPHCVGGLGGEPAGDLFGPYRVPMTPPSEDVLPPGTPADHDIVEEQKRRSGGKFPKSIRASGAVDTFVHKTAKKGKRSASHEGQDQPGLLTVGDSYEVWLHEQCAIWSPGLFIIDMQVVGLEDSVWTALRTKCWQCGVAGAGVGCVVHNCPTRVHYPCAQLSGWLLDDETFIARCQTHRTRLRPGEAHPDSATLERLL